MTNSQASVISEQALSKFAREVAKYPADQKQSAVMACLTIVQEENGFVSSESEKVVADYLGPVSVDSRLLEDPTPSE